MTKRERLQLLITGKTPKILEGFKAFDEGVATLKKNLEETIKVDTLDQVNGKLGGFQKKMEFQPILNAITQLKQELDDSDAQEKKELDSRLISLQAELINADKENTNGIKDIKDEIQGIQTQIADIFSRKPIEIPDFAKQIREAETRVTDLVNRIEKFDDTDLQKEIKKLEEELKKLRLELVNRINERGGGNMNRSIFIGGANAVAKYTDINLKAGSNVTITYVNNDQTKKTDITIASSGGGGGSVRSIVSVAVDTTAGATAGTDYVYLVSGTTTITLPTAVGNTNLYTIKNVGTGVVTVATTSAQTIDGDTTITMPVQFTSVDLISDTANWNIT